MRGRAALLTVSGALFCAVWPGANEAHAEVHVGVIVSATGAAASQGIPERDMIARLPRQLGGEPVRYTVRDDATDPTESVNQARKLILVDQVDLLMGGSNTPSTLAIAQVALENRVAQVSLAPVDVPAAQQPWVFVVPQSADLMMGAVLDHMRDHGVKTVGYIGYSQPWGDLVQHSLATLSTARGVRLLNDERFDRRDSSALPQVLRTLALKPDAVVIGATGTPAVMPHLALLDRGFKGPIYHTHGVVNDDFLRLGGSRVEGALAPIGPGVVFRELPDANPVKPVAEAFWALYSGRDGAGPVNAFATWAYDGYLLADRAVAAALTQARPGTPAFRAAIRDALESRTGGLVGVNGVYQMTASDHNGLDDRARVMVRVSGGTWRYQP